LRDRVCDQAQRREPGESGKPGQRQRGGEGAAGVTINGLPAEMKSISS
jgi:hypothetical protein